MTVSIAFVMDSITAIQPKKDSTIALIKAAAQKGIACYYTTIDDLYIWHEHAYALTRSITLTGDAKSWYALGEERPVPLKFFDAVLMRKDPPVNKRFIHACHMLEHAVRDGVKVLNDPTALLGLNEKLFATHFPDLCPPTLISSNLGILRDFLIQHKKIIIKPLDAMGGEGVFMVNDTDVNFEVIWEIQTKRGTYPVIAQSFLPEISEGDVRVILINGKPFEHALVRTPKTGSIRGNMASGGSTGVRPINATERKIAETVGKVLTEKKILFTGIDIIGDKLIEINITSPTGLRQISDACGIEVADLIIDEVVKN